MVRDGSTSARAGARTVKLSSLIVNGLPQLNVFFSSGVFNRKATLFKTVVLPKFSLTARYKSYAVPYEWLRNDGLQNVTLEERETSIPSLNEQEKIGRSQTVNVNYFGGFIDQFYSSSSMDWHFSPVVNHQMLFLNNNAWSEIYKSHWLIDTEEKKVSISNRGRSSIENTFLFKKMIGLEKGFNLTSKVFDTSVLEYINNTTGFLCSKILVHKKDVESHGDNTFWGESSEAHKIESTPFGRLSDVWNERDRLDVHSISEWNSAHNVSHPHLHYNQGVLVNSSRNFKNEHSFDLFDGIDIDPHFLSVENSRRNGNKVNYIDRLFGGVLTKAKKITSKKTMSLKKILTKKVFNQPSSVVFSQSVNGFAFGKYDSVSEECVPSNTGFEKKTAVGKEYRTEKDFVLSHSQDNVLNTKVLKNQIVNQALNQMTESIRVAKNEYSRSSEEQLAIIQQRLNDIENLNSNDMRRLQKTLVELKNTMASQSRSANVRSVKPPTYYGPFK